MPPKRDSGDSPADSSGMFTGMVVYLAPKGVQARRLQIWKQKLLQMGAAIEDCISGRATHIFAANSCLVHQQIEPEKLKHFKGSMLVYGWLESCLKSGIRVSEDPYILNIGLEGNKVSGVKLDEKVRPEILDSDSRNSKRIRFSPDDSKAETLVAGPINNEISPTSRVDQRPTHHFQEGDPEKNSDSPVLSHNEFGDSQPSSLYAPPDLNKNITEIFGKLINTYRALGDDRRSFSYHKAIPVIEKLPFKIENIDQVKHLPTIGKAMLEHIHEILTTGKMSKLEYFEKDEKVRTVSLFGEVWGIGPATAMKLYEKGHRTLEDLKNDASLTNSQRIGLKYFDDIKIRIPRLEVRDMEVLLQNVGQEILPGVVIICGGSYRRGKAFCGDLDIIITHPDGESHKGFLPKYVRHLKNLNFLREDLIFSTHSTEGTDSGVDTYFGLCVYPGREQRHRIDFKVYPRNIYAFGLIAWTGNDVLNRRLRLLAESKGYRLDDTGLFFAAHGSSGKWGAKSSTGISCSTEMEVFDLLGFPWLEPHQRNL